MEEKMIKGYWKVGMDKYMDLEGKIYDVNPKNGIYRAEYVREDGSIGTRPTMAGSSITGSKLKGKK